MAEHSLSHGSLGKARGHQARIGEVAAPRAPRDRAGRAVPAVDERPAIGRRRALDDAEVLARVGERRLRALALVLAAQPPEPTPAAGGVRDLVGRAPAGPAQLAAQLGRDAVGELGPRDPQRVDGLPRRPARHRPVLAVDVDALVDAPAGEALVEQLLEGRDVAPAHERRLAGGRSAACRPGAGAGARVVVVVGRGARRARAAQTRVPAPRRGQHVVAVALGGRARAVVGHHPGAQPQAADVAGEELEADADVGARLPAAAELVGAVLQGRARQLHRADALVAEAPAAVGQVLAIVVLGDRQQAAGRALDRVAHRVVAEDVAKAGLLLEHRAGQRDRKAGAPGLAHDDGLEAPAAGADRAREGVARRQARRRRLRHHRRCRCRRARGRSDGAAAGRRRRRRPGRARAPRPCAAAWPRRRAGRCARCARARGRAPGTRARRRARCARPTRRRPRGGSCDPRPARCAFRLDCRSAT